MKIDLIRLIMKKAIVHNSKMSNGQEYTTIKIEDLDTNNVSFSDVKSKNEHKTVNLFYNKSKVRLQLPSLRSPFGVSSFKGSDKKHLDLSLGSNSETKKETAEAVLSKLEKLDKFILSAAKKNAKEWFGNPVDDSELKKMYVPTVRLPNDPKYPPTIRQKFGRNKEGDYTVVIWKNKTECHDLTEEDLEDVLQKGCLCKSLIQVVGLWIYAGAQGTKFGVDYRAFQMKYSLPTPVQPTKLSSYAFLEESDSDSDVPEPEL